VLPINEARRTKLKLFLEVKRKDLQDKGLSEPGRIRTHTEGLKL
jgi:hypothetical protein